MKPDSITMSRMVNDLDLNNSERKSPSALTDHRKLNLFSLRLGIYSIAGAFTALSQSNPLATHSALSPEAQAVMKFQKLDSSWNIAPVAVDPLLENPVAIDLDPYGSIYVAETHRFNVSVRDITQNTQWLNADLGLRSVAQRENFLEVAFGDEKNLLTRDSEILRKITDQDGDGIYDSSVVFADGFNRAGSGIAAGVLADSDQVYFASIPELWRFETTSPEATEPASRNILSEGYGVHIGVTGHDLHGLTWGPDGRLYYSVGDRGFSVQTQEGNWLDFPDTGGVMRCEPDGANLEVFAYGMRNPQELAFDAFGNLFTGDNDTSGADQSRLLYVVQNGDYGWRCSYQHQEGFGPWVQENVWQGRIDGTLPTSGYVAQGPSGLSFYPGVGLPDDFQHTFFHCDFPGGIWNFKVQPDGAGFALDFKRKFLWDLWPTDVTFGPDGSIFIADWISGWVMPDKGRIYRMEPGQSFFETSPGVVQLKQQTKSALQANWPNSTAFVDSALKYLSHPDQRVRAKARRWISTHSSQSCVWEAYANARPDNAESESELIAQVEWIWTAWQTGWRHASRSSEIASLLEPLLKANHSEVRAQSARVLGDLKIQSARSEFQQLLSDPSPRVRFFAAMGLSHTGSADAIPALVQSIEQNNDQDPFLTHAHVMAFLKCSSESDIIGFTQSTHLRSVRRAALLALRQLKSPSIANLLHDTDPNLQYEAARAIYDVPIPEAYPSLAEVLGNPTINPAVYSRSIEANARIGSKEAAQRLILHALKSTSSKEIPTKSRTHAIQALTRWKHPSPIDPIMGLWRPYNFPPDRHPDTIRKLLESELASNPLNAMEPELGVQWIQTLQELNLRSLADWIDNSFDPSEVSVRIAALNALMEWQTESSSKRLLQTLSDPAVDLQTAAFSWLDPNRYEDTVALLKSVILNPGGTLNLETSTKMGQVALKKLSELSRDNENPPAMEAFIEISKSFLVKSPRPDWELEWLTGVEGLPNTNPSASIRLYLEEYQRSSAYKNGNRFLSGGQLEIGSRLFFNKQEIACSRCHQVKANGGVVGPALDQVANRLTPDEILKSILEPNATIAEGFESILITTITGDFYSGILKKETEQQLVLQNLDQGEVTIEKNDILSRERGPSAMPDGLETFLTPEELRDLMAYLISLKE